MKKKLVDIALILICVAAFIILLTGCGKSKEIECDVDVITIRQYSVTKEKGLFTTKKNTIDYIEYTFEYNGEIILDTVKPCNLKVGDRTKVHVMDDGDGWVTNDLYLSLEDYKELYGSEEFWKNGVDK